MSDEIKIPAEVLNLITPDYNWHVEVAYKVARWMREECAKVADGWGEAPGHEMAEAIRRVGVPESSTCKCHPHDRVYYGCRCGNA